MAASSVERSKLGLIFAVAAALLTYFLLPESCPDGARRCAAVFAFAAISWATEPIPLWATSLLVILLLVFSLGKPGGILNMAEQGREIFFIPLSNPVFLLFLSISDSVWFLL